MASVKMEDLENYVSTSVDVCIHGREGEDQAPSVSRKIHKLEFCPDETHLRIFFDKHFFVAVPLTSTVEQSNNEWRAFDQDAGLYYVIRGGN